MYNHYFTVKSIFYHDFTNFLQKYDFLFFVRGQTKKAARFNSRAALHAE